MNRKIKKQIKIVAVVFFFLIAGIVYLLSENTTNEKRTEGTEMTGVLEADTSEISGEYLPDLQASEKTESVQEELIVHVCGAVKEPGIYMLTPGSRLYEAVAMAGGFSAEADSAYHNLAREISDGERIYILSVEETETLSVQHQAAGEEGVESNSGENVLINLNTATAEQLMQLPGVGAAKAADILEYRTKIGHFTSIEEIKNISGIGDAMYGRIKDKITVK